MKWTSLEDSLGWLAWLRLAKQPMFATVANALGVFAGLMGALYTDDIRNAFPFQYQNLGDLSPHAVAFWFSFLIFAFTFLSREWSVDRQRVESEKRLEETIRTMPPRGYVLEFARYFELCHKAVRALEGEANPTRDQIRPVVRVVLSSIAHLARRFDGAEGSMYAANIMLYFENSSAWKANSGIASDLSIKFVERDTAADRVPVLVMDKTLSASTKSGPAGTNQPDPDMNDIVDVALPVPKQEQGGRTDDGKRWRVLPGAPLTFFTLEPTSYQDTDGLGKWCRDHGDFSESVCLEVDRYFGQELAKAGIRSFASIPLASIDDKFPIGVLNLHANRVGILTDPGAPSQFFPLVRPFTALLADSLRKYLSTKN
jgi:hypothetical protein